MNQTEKTTPATFVLYRVTWASGHDSAATHYDFELSREPVDYHPIR